MPAVPLTTPTICVHPLGCSGESHDTAGSSQRSVLIPPSCSTSAARNHLATKAAAGAQPGTAAAAPCKPAWGRPASTSGPANQQLAASPIYDESTYPPLSAAAQQQQQPHEEEQQQQQATNGDCCTELGTPPAAAAAAAASAGGSSPSAALPADLPGSTAAEKPETAVQGEAAALAAEVAALRAEVAALRLQERSEAVHRIELASVLEDTAAHEAAAVAEAVAAERMNCIYRFAAFLQVRRQGGQLQGGSRSRGTRSSVARRAARPATCLPS